MNLWATIVFVSMIALAQKPPAAQPKAGPAPSIGFSQTGTTPGLVDTDLFDEQKYIEQTRSDSSSVKEKRASHEASLSREFFNAFGQVKECDGIVFVAKNGDEKPEFTLQIMVDTHDTPGQKPEWVWVLSTSAKGKFVAKAEEDTSTETAKNICLAVVKAEGAGEPTTARK
jgi:hypothetical protein